MINTLVGLLAALTVGTITLMVMETDPVVPKVRSLIAASDEDPMRIVRDTDVPLQSDTWESIVVHATGSEGAEITRLCHFIIAPRSEGDGFDIESTLLWRTQGHSLHILGTNEHLSQSSIAVCLVGDYTATRPPERLLRQLLALVRSLQFDFRIAKGHVYLYRDLDTGTFSPGRAFPESSFTARLLRTGR